MKNYIIHKTEITPEYNFLFVTTIVAIILAVKTEEYIALSPIIVLTSISLFLKLILFVKWQGCYAIKLNQEQLILNHTILYNKITIPLQSIISLNREQKCVELKENSNIKIPRLVKINKNKNKIFFLTLTDNERKELFDKMEELGIISLP